MKTTYLRIHTYTRHSLLWRIFQAKMYMVYSSIFIVFIHCFVVAHRGLLSFFLFFFVCISVVYFLPKVVCVCVFCFLARLHFIFDLGRLNGTIYWYYTIYSICIQLELNTHNICIEEHWLEICLCRTTHTLTRIHWLTLTGRGKKSIKLKGGWKYYPEAIKWIKSFITRPKWEAISREHRQTL